MRISRQLQIALVFSVLWHLFWMSFVSVIFLPKGLAPRRYAAVNFWGSILKDSFVKQEDAGERTRIVNLPSEAEIRSSTFFQTRPDRFLPLKKRRLNPDKFVDLDTSAAHRQKGMSVPKTIAARPAGLQRETIFQPSLPKFLDWTEQEFAGLPVIFKIYISADGLVEQTINIKGSGNPELDAVLARYVQRWRFAPAENSGGQWQIVKVQP